MLLLLRGFFFTDFEHFSPCPLKSVRTTPITFNILSYLLFKVWKYNWINQHAKYPSNKYYVCVHRSRIDENFSLMPSAHFTYMLNHLIGIRCILKHEKCPYPSYLVAHLFHTEAKWWLRTIRGHITKLKTRPLVLTHTMCLVSSCRRWKMCVLFFESSY